MHFYAVCIGYTKSVASISNHVKIGSVTCLFWLPLLENRGSQNSHVTFFCVGVVYSGEYDVCDVTLSVYLHRASLKNMPGHGGNRTYDLWNTSLMLGQLSYAVRSVRVSDISEQNLVPSIFVI